MKTIIKVLKSLITIANICAIGLFILLILKDNEIDLLHLEKYEKVENYVDEFIPQDIIMESDSSSKSDEEVEVNIISSIDLSSFSQTKIEKKDKIYETDDKDDEEEEESQRFVLYDQIGEDSKYIYKALQSNFDKILEGQTTINLGNYLSDYANSENFNKLQQVYQSAMTAFTYDNPEAFVLDTEKMNLYLDERGVFSIDVDEKYSNYFKERFTNASSAKRAIQKVRDIRSQVVSSKTRNLLDDAKLVHDYLVDTIEYDNSSSAKNKFDLYGALIDNRCVCDGYAKAFSYIMDEMGYDTIRVVGEGRTDGTVENHAWNLVYYGSTYYGVDCTWDDPINNTGYELSKKDKYRFFMVNNSEFKNSHYEYGQFSDNGQVFDFPDI